jgi:hypothetical protein
MQLPAFCRSCGNAFPSGFAGEDSQAITFEGCTSGPCPWCGGPTGDVPSGTYDFFEKSVEIVRGEGLGIDRLRKYLAVIEAGAAQGASSERVLEEIKAEAPNLVRKLRDASNNPYAAGLITWALSEAIKALL